jgi:hypothetical protein
MSSFVTFESWRISLSVCRWGSSYSFWWCWWGLSVGDTDWWGLGSRLGLTGIDHPRKSTLFYVEECVLGRKRLSLPQKLRVIFWSCLLSFHLLYSNAWHLNCNNFNLNYIYSIVCLYVLYLYILTSSRIPHVILGRRTPHDWGGSVTFVHSNKQLCSSSLFPVQHLAMFLFLPPQIPYPFIKVNFFPSQYLNIFYLIPLFILSSIWKLLYRNNLWSIRPRNTLIYMRTLWCLFLIWRASTTQ